MIERTNREEKLQESADVWEQLLRLAEGGDIRAIKLYYDMLEKKQRSVPHDGTAHGGITPDMEPMAAIRRAVFGDAAVDAAAVLAAGHPGETAAMEDAGQGGWEDVRPDDGQEVPDAVEEW